jgi:hypothetical protein
LQLRENPYRHRNAIRIFEMTYPLGKLPAPPPHSVFAGFRELSSRKRDRAVSVLVACWTGRHQLGFVDSTTDELRVTEIIRLRARMLLNNVPGKST